MWSAAKHRSWYIMYRLYFSLAILRYHCLRSTTLTRVKSILDSLTDTNYSPRAATITHLSFCNGWVVDGSMNSSLRLSLAVVLSNNLSIISLDIRNSLIRYPTTLAAPTDDMSIAIKINILGKTDKRL